MNEFEGITAVVAGSGNGNGTGAQSVPWPAGPETHGWGPSTMQGPSTLDGPLSPLTPVSPVSPAATLPPVPPKPPLPDGVVTMPAGVFREMARDYGHGATDAAASAGGAKPSRKRTMLLLAIGGIVGSLIFALVNFLVVPLILKGKPAESVGVDDALAEFRGSEGSSSPSAAAGDQTAPDPGAAAPADAGAVADTSATGTAADDPGAAAAQTEGDQAAQAAPVLRPPAGVYTFGATGSESTKPGSLSAETNAVGPEVAAVVRHSGNSCWSLELKFNSKHTTSDTFCAGAGSLNMTGGFSDSLSYGQKVHNQVDCNPAVDRVRPAMSPGASWQGTCKISTSGAASSTSTSQETWSFVGVETVAGTPAWHLRGLTTSSGGANGKTEQHVWISQTNGMVLEFKRKVNMVSTVPVIGNVVYSEEINGTIKSLTPQT